MPEALETLNKQHQAKTASLNENNSDLTQRLGKLERNLDDSEIACVKKDVEIVQKMGEAACLEKELKLAVLGIAARDWVLKHEFHTTLPSPFAKETGKYEGGATNAGLI